MFARRVYTRQTATKHVQHGATSLHSIIFQFACIIVFGMMTMFLFGYYIYIQYRHLEITNKQT